MTAVASRSLVRGSALTDALRDRYGSDLAIPLRPDRPTVIVNFVTTLDGVVSYAVPGSSGGGEISGFLEHDRFVMGLLRAHADALMVGAGTFRQSRDTDWNAAEVHPGAAAEYAEVRARLGLERDPLTVVVSGSGDLDARHPAFERDGAGVIVLTTERGADALRRGGLPHHVIVEPVGVERAEPDLILRVLARRGVQLALCEGGPQLFGDLLAARMVDELFLTLAPQLAGRTDELRRRHLVEGTAFAPADAPWGRLVDLRRVGDHIFTRYRFAEEAAP